VQFAHQANDKPPPLPYIPDMMKKPLPYHPALFQRAVGEMAFLPREALRLSSGIFSKMGDFVGILWDFAPLLLARDHPASSPPLPALKMKTSGMAMENIGGQQEPPRRRLPADSGL
jgi:hypothetical protein